MEMSESVQKFYVDASGNFVGSFCGAEPPDGSVEVATPPEDVRQVWNGAAWGAVPVTVPAAVTPRQIRLALNQSGIRDAIESFVASSSQNVKDTWEFATLIERDYPIIAANAAALGMTDAQIDDLFILAATF